MRLSKYVYVIPLVLFAVTRLYYLQNTEFSDWTKGDAIQFVTIAQNLSTNGSFSLDGSDSDVNALWRPPLWPVLLSFLNEFASDKSSLMVLKMIFEAGLLFVLFVMVKPLQLGDMFNGMILSMMAIEPHFLKYSAIFLSENFTAIMLVFFTGSFLYSVTIGSQLATCSCAAFGALSVLSHPIVFVYVVLLLGLCMLLTKRIRTLIPSLFVFIFVFLSWPVRNHLTFCQGFFMTTSQGAVFSKSWNDDVLKYFNNTKGDALDEYKNVSRHPDLLARLDSNPINNSKILAESTSRFVSETGFLQLSRMALWKLYCGINPIPQTHKPGMVETMAIFFRLLYLTGLILGAYALLTHRFESNTISYWSAWILVLVFVAVSITSVVLYTGLRFNSVYAPVSLVMTFFVIQGLWKSYPGRVLNFLPFAK